METDLDASGSKTYAVLMLSGSDYRELTAVNGSPLTGAKQEAEKKKLRDEIARRKRETPTDRAPRIADFEKDQRRGSRFIQEFSEAFSFNLIGIKKVSAHVVYEIGATPLPGYKPIDKESQVLTGMRGRLYIDRDTDHWLRAEAEVIHPVSIEGFLAAVEPGTRFELDKAPVGPGVWLPTHFVMRADAKVLGLFHHRDSQNQTYFNYRKAILDVSQAALLRDDTATDEKHLSNTQASLAAVLTCVAGYVDAIGYLVLGQVYVANMSGNSVAVGIYSARVNWPQIWTHGWPIVSYVCGLLLSRFVVTLIKRNGLEAGPAIAFALQAAFLAWFMAVNGGAPGVFLCACAMGIQAATLSRFGTFTVYTAS